MKTIDELAAQVDRLEEQNKALLRGLGEVLQILRARSHRGAPAPAEQLERKRSRWNAKGGWWETFLDGTGWVRDWHNKAPAPEDGR